MPRRRRDCTRKFHTKLTSHFSQLKESSTDTLYLKYSYKELIPEISTHSLNYNQTVEAATSIISAQTSLESQTLVFAFGGPDLFFARTSPSRGFDLLPDSFSRVVVSVVTIGLVIVLFVVQRIGSNKALKQGWL